MRLPYTLVVTLLAQSAFGWTPAKRSYDTHDYYVLEHDPSSGASLVDVALALGVEVVEQAGALRNHWLVRTTINSILPREENTDIVLRNFEDLRSRAASHLSSRSEDALHVRSVVSSVKYLSARQELYQRVKRAPPPIRPPTTQPSIYDVAQKFGIVDPLFPKQWHLVNEKYPQHMMNVTPLWELGFTGKGVISSVIDDGLDYTSEDLAANFVCFTSSLLVNETDHQLSGR
jgi:kexin